MEGFEHLVKVAMDHEGLVCSGPMKFPVRRPTRKKDRIENQTHGYEVDLVGARKDLLVLASVKSFLGSKGVGIQGFMGLADESKKHNYRGYALFNFKDIQEGVITGAAERFGYATDQVELRLYVGKFKNEAARTAITGHLAKMHVGRGPVRVVGLEEILSNVLAASKSKTYLNDPVIVTVKSFNQYGGQKLKRHEQ